MRAGVLAVPIYILSYALFLYGYSELEAVKFMHPAAFAAFFLGTAFWLVSFLPTLLRVELSMISLALTIASIGLACADSGCETAMTLFPACTLFYALWAATAIYWRHRSDRYPRYMALVWYYGPPVFLIQLGIGMYFQFYPIVR